MDPSAYGVKVNRPKEWKPELAAHMGGGGMGGAGGAGGGGIVGGGRISKEEQLRKELGLGNDDDADNSDEEVGGNWGFGDDVNSLTKDAALKRLKAITHAHSIAVQENQELRAQLNDVCERQTLIEQKHADKVANLKQIADSRVAIFTKQQNEKFLVKAQELEDERSFLEMEQRKGDLLRSRIEKLTAALSAAGISTPPQSPDEDAAVERDVERRLNRRVERLQAETVNLRQQLDAKQGEIHSLEEDIAKLKETASNLLEVNHRLKVAADRRGNSSAASTPTPSTPSNEPNTKSNNNNNNNSSNNNNVVVDNEAMKNLQEEMRRLMITNNDKDAAIAELQNQLKSARAAAAAAQSAPTPSPSSTPTPPPSVAAAVGELELKEFQEKSREFQEKSREMSEKIQKLEGAVQEKDKLLERAKTKLTDLQSQARQRIADLENELNQSKAQRGMSEATQKAILVQISRQKADLKQLRDSCAELRHHAVVQQGEIFPVIKWFYGQLRKKLENHTSHIMEKYRAEMKERKRLFNLVQELKGNIRVYCRVRPLLSHEIANGEPCVASFPDENEVAFFDESKNADKSFEFEKVFGIDSKQEEVFNELEGLITSCLDGYNVCIFAYGQTGSGKTYTMEGTPDEPGVNPRALRRLFSQIQERSGDFTFGVTVSIVEIYLEEIHDLLQTNYNKKLEIRQGPQGNFVQDCTVVEVSSADDVQEYWSRGSQNRKSASNNVNAHSSRSHLILQLTIDAFNSVNGTRTFSKLNLIDLAGSERVARTQAEGDRLDEAKAINKSLSALGGVIQSLGQKQSHVRFRDTKLTHLLQDSLNGDAKTLMIVQVSPSKIDLPESLCSLDFASRARAVELGQARRNVTAGGASGGITPGRKPK